MPLDYRTIRYLEKVGNTFHIHYIDGKTVVTYPDGRGRYLIGVPGDSVPPEEYDPWEPPVGDPPPPAPGDWSHPLEGAVMTSGFGMRAGGMHYGVDFSTTTAPTGGPVRSVTDMVVTVAVDAFEGGNQTAGTYVKGHSPDGAYTFTYNHGADESLLVEVGDTVTPGQQLFTEGATGNVTGTHLHFEIILGNWPNPWAPPYNNGATFVDPLPILRDHGVNV
jgi:murein DD-endopeptidase MepM/ murein hydrolase activator NlpD